MPKIATELGPLALKRLPAGLHAAGGVPGLMLNVTATGARQWVFRYRLDGKRHDMGLGGFPEVAAALAREKAAAYREALRQGRDPLLDRRTAVQAAVLERQGRRTLAELLPDFLAARTAGLRNAKHAAQWRSTLETYAAPLLRLPAGAVRPADVLECLTPIWTTKPETARRVRGRIEALLDYAAAAGARPDGPNAASWTGSLKAGLSARRAVAVRHHAAVPLELVPALYERISGLPGTAAAALRFAVLTAARSGEVRGADWQEIDLQRRVWAVPAGRMKAGRAHVVALSRDAVALLEALPHRQGLLFPNEAGGVLSDMALAAVIRRLNDADAGRWRDTDGRTATPHGVARACFKTWATERTDAPRAVVEGVLAHASGDKLEAAYQRSDLAERRAALLNQWADFLAGRVVALADRRKGATK
jgi:integrase